MILAYTVECPRCSAVVGERCIAANSHAAHVVQPHGSRVRRATRLERKRQNMIENNKEGFTENTLFKVYDSLRAAGLTEEQSREAINDMQNKGILFRERMDSAKAKPVLRRGGGGRNFDQDEDDE